MGKTKPSTMELPPIDCVVIGVNAAATLERCLSSLRRSNYPPDRLHIYYADGGSYDRSLEVAAGIPAVEIVALDPDYPTPGLGRNAGWKAGKSPLVHFFDSDTIVHPDWLATAVTALTQGVAAVRGNRCELFPSKTVYNWIGSLEWNASPGEVESFGGDVLVRRKVLEQTGGYDEILVGGEDPELSRRIRLAGWQIIQLDQEMTQHDLAMTTLGQYWKRAYRSGYAFAAVIDRFAGQGTGFWFVEGRRILIRGGGSLSLLLTVPFLLWLSYYTTAIFLTTIALILLFFPRLFRVDYFRRSKNLVTAKEARIYAWHCSLVVIPDILGVTRFYLGKLFNRPLRNRRKRLATATLDHRP